MIILVKAKIKLIQNKAKSLKLGIFKESLSASRDVYFSFSFSRFPFLFQKLL